MIDIKNLKVGDFLQATNPCIMENSEMPAFGSR
jgi:hypothetical protein